MQNPIMVLHLSGDKKIEEVKKQFTGYFPYLQLEFYKLKHETMQHSDLENAIGNNHTLSEINVNLLVSVFSFEPYMTVADFEQSLQQQFGLPSQVFRKSGDIWIETAETDNLSLEEQNNIGKASQDNDNFN